MKLVLVLSILSLTLFAQDKEAKALSHESALSAVQTGGNAVSESYDFSTDTSYKPGTREYRLFGNYTLAYADDPEVEGIDKEETARNWKVGAEATQDLTEKVGATVGQSYEGNEFAGYKQRENSDLGLKYRFIRTDKIKSSFELGYRYTTEMRTTRDDDGKDVFSFNKANLYFTISQKLNEQVSYKFWIQYLPNFTEAEDYQINFEPSLTVKMSDILSLRVAYKGQYDNQLNPGVEERLDHTTTTALVAKF